MIDIDNNDIPDAGVWVRTSFEIEYAKLSKEKLEHTLDDIICHKTSDRLGFASFEEDLPKDLKTLAEVEQIPEHFLKMWTSIDTKLDMLLRSSGLDRFKLENSSKGHVKNMCHKGLDLMISKEAKRDEMFLLRITPPTFPIFTIDAVAKVLFNDTDKNCCRMIFEAIHEEDKELVISYVFKRQREILRSQIENEYFDKQKKEEG